jgi:DNA primase
MTCFSGKWLDEHLAQCNLTPEVEDYLLGRGVKESTIKEEGIVTWSRSKVPFTDLVFRKRYGAYGEFMDGYLTTPVYSPRGQVIGFEGRSIYQKRISDYRLPEAAWNPFWLGMKKAMPKIWAGGNIWVVEGLFDLSALEWAVSEKDVVLASVRAKLSFAHVEFLRRFCRGTVHMTYDRDSTGRAGVIGWVDDTGKKHMGAMQVLKKAGLDCRDVFYKGGKDPGEIWSRYGKEGLLKAFQL